MKLDSVRGNEEGEAGEIHSDEARLNEGGKRSGDVRRKEKSETGRGMEEYGEEQLVG